MFTFLRLFAVLFVLVFLSSCNAKRVEIFSSTTVAKHVGYENKQTKIDEGVYLLVESGASDMHADLMKKLVRSAAKLTLSKGYRRFVIFPDEKNDEELEEALNKKRARKLYLKRIAEKSKDMGRARVLVQRRGAIHISQDLFAVIVMLKKGRAGIPAKYVRQASGRAPYAPNISTTGPAIYRNFPGNPGVKEAAKIAKELFTPKKPAPASR